MKLDFQRVQTPSIPVSCRSSHAGTCGFRCCDGNTAAQNWTIDSNGTLTIAGGCMDITGAKSANGTLIELWTCNGGANQHWTLP